MLRLKLLVLLLLSCFATIYAQSHTSYIEPYAELLDRYVTADIKDGISVTLVDYQEWKEDSTHGVALKLLSEVDLTTLSRNEALAFWMNAYNLLTIDLIIRSGEKESIRNQGSIFKNVWKSHDWKIAGKTVTLHEIEHGILRPMGEARIHMAINCASVSCPDLRNEPYIATRLEEQLDDQVRLFFQQRKKGVSVSKNTVYLSKIFKWFEDDFGGEKGVRRFLDKYGVATESELYSIRYLNYNWNLNAQ